MLQVYICIQLHTFVLKSQEPVDDLTEEEQFDKAAQVTVSKQKPSPYPILALELDNISD